MYGNDNNDDDDDDGGSTENQRNQDSTVIWLPMYSTTQFCMQFPERGSADRTRTKLKTHKSNEKHKVSVNITTQRITTTPHTNHRCNVCMEWNFFCRNAANCCSHSSNYSWFLHHFVVAVVDFFDGICVFTQSFSWNLFLFGMQSASRILHSTLRLKGE